MAKSAICHVIRAFKVAGGESLVDKFKRPAVPVADWRTLLTQQSDTWLEHKAPERYSDVRDYARQFDTLNCYRPVRYQWDEPKPPARARRHARS